MLRIELKALMIIIPCRKSVVVDCNIVHVYRWISLFIFLHNLSKSQSELNILKFLIRKGEKIP
jgi:hypothetical protein